MRRRLVALAVLAVVVVGAVVCGGGGGRPPRSSRRDGPHRCRTRDHPARAARQIAGPPYRVAHLSVLFIDRRRRERLPFGAEVPRRLRTLVLYPRVRASGRRFPLVIFGHGFAVTPLTYGSLLRYWAAQGFVVAAPSFRSRAPARPAVPTKRTCPTSRAT